MRYEATWVRAGDIVMTGSMQNTKFAEEPNRLRLDITGLETVEL